MAKYRFEYFAAIFELAFQDQVCATPPFVSAAAVLLPIWLVFATPAFLCAAVASTTSSPGF
jgi:hypothetical protein